MENFRISLSHPNVNLDINNEKDTGNIDRVLELIIENKNDQDKLIQILKNTSLKYVNRLHEDGLICDRSGADIVPVFSPMILDKAINFKKAGGYTSLLIPPQSTSPTFIHNETIYGDKIENSKLRDFKPDKSRLLIGSRVKKTAGVIGLITILATLIAVITDSFDLFDRIKDSAPSTTKSQGEANLIVIKEGYSVYKNDRFGFLFQYPKTWLNDIGPSNSDGQNIFHPNNREINITGSGMYFSEVLYQKDLEVEPLPSDYENEIEFIQFEHFISDTHKDSKNKLIEKGRFIKSLPYKGNREFIFGYTVFEIFEGDTHELYWVKSIYSAIGNKSFTLTFVCPKKALNNDLLNIFNEVASSFDLKDSLDEIL